MKGIFLDLDGTLINSEKAFSRCFIDVLNNQFGARLNLDDYRRYELEKNALLIKYAKEMGMIRSDIDDKDIMNIVYNNYEDYFKEIIKEEEAVDNFRLIRELKDKYLLGFTSQYFRKLSDLMSNPKNKKYSKDRIDLFNSRIIYSQKLLLNKIKKKNEDPDQKEKNAKSSYNNFMNPFMTIMLDSIENKKDK